MSMRVSANLPAHWHDALGRLGFSATADGSYRCNGTLFKVTGQWATLESHSERPLPAPLNITPPQPALWKWIDDGSCHRRVFELPMSVLTREPFDESTDTEPTPAFRSCLAWALETVKPRVMEKWPAPSRQR